MPSDQPGAPSAVPARTSPGSAISRAARKKIVASAMIGQTLEWYDFAVYGYFAATIGKNFFSAQTPVVQLLSSFAVFGAGFVMRPVGAFLMGHFGDKYGRRRTFSATLLLMAIATCLIGLLPTYHDIGVTAVVLLVFLRLCQGLSNGGEFGGSVTYLTESAPPERRGFFGSFQQATLAIGLLLGTLVSVLLSQLISAPDLQSWGWRIPFLLGAVLAIPGYYIRRQVSDTPEFQALQESGKTSRAPVLEAFRNHWRDMLRTFPLANSPAYYVLMVYLPTFLQSRVGYSSTEALLVTLSLQVVYIGLMPLAGILSDRIGRKPTLLAGYVLTGALVYPVFTIISTGSRPLAVVALMPMAVGMALMFAPLATTLTELFPGTVRYSAVAIPYGIHAAILGGFTPFLATLLVGSTGSSATPSFLVIGIVLLSFIAVLRFPETKGRPLQ
ncbi:MFS transporter [Amycolatopsis jejuensis]|uniref:MFS transporter n=1 Tax=Amycolatopsis jejuensis TaxID=330084 RepID=UPI00068B1622|nr:MFS transporter [Amycolatopsis jejuensis]